jgi:hypothetical protein
VNDFFIGPQSHISARYVIKHGGRQEQHSSSGIIVSTGLGSTGWFKSLMAGAAAISRQFGPTSSHAQPPAAFPWEADYLFFTVREPFPSKTSAAELVMGKITAQAPLELTSQMPEAGVIFSDGIEHDFLEFNAGTKATIAPADKRGRLVV